MNFHLTRLVLVIDAHILICRKVLFLLPFIFFFFCCKEDPDILNPEKLNQWKYYDSLTGLSNNYIWNIFQDKDGNIWVGTNGGGVNKFDGYQWTDYTVNDGLTSDYVYAISQDNVGDMWFCAGGGINWLIDGAFYYLDSIEGIPIKPVRILHDSHQRMWVGTLDSGLIIFSGNNYSNITHFSPENEKLDSITALTEDNSGTIWIGTKGGALFYKDDEFNLYDSVSGLYNNDLLYIMQDSWGDIWFASKNSEYLTRYDGANTEYIYLYHGYAFTYVYSITEDLKGNIWFASGPAGIVKYNGMETYTLELPDRFKNDWFLCSLKDQDGNIWFGTMKNGIVKYITE